jgi:SAM-dependent methyltransferase
MCQRLKSRMSTWREIWNGDVGVYVSDRHKQAHYRRIAADIGRLLPPGQQSNVLDYGAGDALDAGTIAARCRKLYLSDGAERVRQGLANRFAGDPRVAVLAPEEVDSVPDGSIDRAVLCSVLQYLPADERDNVLRLLARKLAPAGLLIVADVIAPDHKALADVVDLLRFAAREGFLADALIGLVRLAFSGYRKQRALLGLARYSPTEMASVLARAGLSCRRLDQNIGPNQGRMAFEAGRRG